MFQIPNGPTSGLPDVFVGLAARCNSRELVLHVLFLGEMYCQLLHESEGLLGKCIYYNGSYITYSKACHKADLTGWYFKYSSIRLLVLGQNTCIKQ